MVRATTKDKHGRVRWTPAHPERTKLKGEWSVVDSAIHEADAIASGHSRTTMLSKVEVSRTLLSGVRVPQLMRDGVWYEGSLEEEVASHRLRTFLDKRGCSLIRLHWTQGLHVASLTI